MTRTISAAEARNNWDAMLSAASNGEDVIVEADGGTKSVVISPEAYEDLQQARKLRRRTAALKQLDAIEQEQLERNKDLTQKQADELANRFAHEFFDELAAEGKLRFARDRR